MGEVWKARDTRLERNVAIKTLPAEFAQNAQLKLRFEREAKTISQLNHAHICTLYDVGDDYLVMELIEGESLAERLVRGPLPLAEVLKYGAQIAEALDRAHRAGVVHRDLKPGNIMITRGGAKLLDFGLAKSAMSMHPVDDATMHKPLTQEGVILGTFQYMAPEQLAGEEADPRTDIFALGTVLYEMMTGSRAFEGKTRTSLVSQIVAGEPRPLKELQPLTPPALEHVIAKCLSKDRDDRWQSASDIAEDLRWIGEQRSDPTQVAGQRLPWRRNAKLVTTTAAVMTLLAASFGVLWWQSRARPRTSFTTSVLAPPAHSFNFENGAVTLSPDGLRLVFIASDADNKSSLFVHDLQSGQVRKLEGTATPGYPFWSPDSRDVAFFSDHKLKVIDIASGPPQTLAVAPDGRGGSWSAAGNIVYAASHREGLWVIPAAGGTPKVVTKLEKGEISHRWAQFLPDGDHVVFLVQRAEGGAPDDPSTLEVVSMSTGKRQPLLRANSSVMYATPGYLLFFRDGSLLAQAFDAKSLTLSGSPMALAPNTSYSGTEQVIASVSDAGTLVYHAGGKLGQSRLVSSTRSGINTSAIPQYGVYSGPALSPDGNLLAVSLVDQTEDIRIFDLKRGTTARFTFHSADEYSPVWSPDGEWIAFGSNRVDPGDVYRKRASGQGAEEALLVTPQSMRPTGFSPDGRRLLIESSGSVASQATKTDILIYALAEKTLTPLVQTPFNEGAAVFSPDGRWVAYSSDESGRLEVYVQPAAGGSPWQVSADGGGTPRWRGDSQELYYLGPDNAVMAVRVTAGPSFAAGKPQLLFTFRLKRMQRGFPVPSFDVDASGEHFILNHETANTDAPITVVQNWTARLTRNQ